MRPVADATREILESYASLINVQSDDLVLWGEDLTSVFEAINYEFSVFGFHDRVLADAKDFVMPEKSELGMHGSMSRKGVPWRH